jgi:uncharacterized protein (DUF1015 family)
MAEVAPFRGCRYDTAVAGEMRKLIAPPYDVIDSTLRDTLFRLSEYNIARITRADRRDNDPNPYAGAGELWARWRRDGVVRPEEQPALYVYEQYFDVYGQKFSRTALIALLRLRKPGEGVLPHENTLSGPRADRLDLMRATRSQLGQVFGLYDDPARIVDKLLDEAKEDVPLVSASDRTDLLHRLWTITDPEKVRLIQEALRDKEVLIADGHHRYETSLAYEAEDPGNPAAQWRMMALVNMNNAGLVILPTHRLVKALADFDPAKFLETARRNFRIKTYPGDAAAVLSAVTEAIRELQAEGRHAFGLALADGNYHVLILRDETAMDADASHSQAWRRLDVTILQKLLLDDAMGIDQERLATGANVEYIQDFPHAVEEAAGRVRDGAAQALFLLNPTRVEEVQAVARNHERMPQKSTFFYPKVYTGMVFYCMTELPKTEES